MSNPGWKQTHVNTFSASDTGPHLLNHAQPQLYVQELAQFSMSANTGGRHAQLLIFAHTWRYSSLNMCRHTCWNMLY
jgi:hypothetical protein